MRPNSLKNPWLVSLTGFLVVLGLFGSYRWTVDRARQIHYQIFNVEETVSWAEQESGIYRREAKGHLDNLLLSKDSWRWFELGFDLYHPRDCGLIFSYQDSQTYHFLYFNQATRSIFWAKKTDRGTQVIKRHALPQQKVLQGRLVAKEGRIRLFFGDRLFSEINLDAPDGLFGILINDADDPRTIFRHVTVKGMLSNGQEVHGSSPPTYQKSGLRYILAVLPLYLAMMVACLYLAWMVFPIASGMRAKLYHQREEGRLINGWSAAFVHFVLTAVIFSPFLLRREIFVSSYDNIGEIYPLVFLSKHKFAEMIQARSWSLWNPYFHDGTPFFSSHWNMIYYPLNWLLFWVSDRGLMTALTLKTFVEVFLTGLLAYLFFSREIPSRFWALVSSVCYQICSFLIFSLSIYPTISLYLSMTLYLYLVWSLSSRRAVWNYLILAVAVYMIMTSANVVFIFYVLLALGVITLYRLLNPPSGFKWGSVLTVTAAGLTGLALSAVRIIPCIQAIMNSNRIVQDYYTIHDRLIMFIRLWIPEIAGGFGPDRFNALTSAKLQLIFRQMDMPSNPQNAFFVYFGIIPAILILSSFLIKTRGSHAFWKIYAFVALAIGLLLQPFWGVLSILFFPLFHFSYHVIIIPVGVCALIGHTGGVMEREQIHIRAVGKRLVLLLTVILAAIAVFWTYLFPNLTQLIRWILIAGLTTGGVTFGLRRWGKHLVPAWAVARSMALNVVTWSLLLFAGTLLLLKPISHKEIFSETVWIPFLTIIVIVQTALIFYGLLAGLRKRPRHSQWISVFVLSIPIVLVILFSHTVFRQILVLGEGLRIYALDNILAIVRILVIIQLTLWAFVLYKVRMLPRFVFRILILIVLVGDLLVFNMRFDNITAPFYHKEAFYHSSFAYPDIRPELRQGMDLTNYRVHALHRAGLNANKNVIYNLPSYTGTLGYLSRRFSEFINQFGYPKGTILIYPADIAKNQRFLDLSAVRYTIENETSFSERPSALARMNIYGDYKVLKDRQAILAQLSDPSFDPHQTVLLENEPNISFRPEKPTKAQPVLITDISSDRVGINLVTETPVIILFNESYHSGWQAFLNTTRIPVIRANYHFMACAVPAGHHELTFKFKPRIFTFSLVISLLACLCLILIPVINGILHKHFQSR